jgi:hypothetical protein
MNRRQALKNVAYLMGGAISATTMGVLFESFTVLPPDNSTVFYSSKDVGVLAEFAEIIIPTTATSPGAKAAGLGDFIPRIIKECYPEHLQLVFANGYKSMLEKCKKDFKKDFLELSKEEKNKLMNTLKEEAIASNKAPSFFILARDLTILGYFSSEIGCTQAREYLPVPGRYDGSAPYTPGQKAWAT